MGDSDNRMTRRDFLAKKVRIACAVTAAGAFGLVHPRETWAGTVWQIDPAKCTQCGKCATECVLGPSAVKCVHAHAVCGHCELCFGFFEAQPNSLNEAAENQRCPTGAIKRTFIEDPYFGYVIDEKLCIGCAKCVKGCNTFGNGSLFLQVRHDRCVNCNQCSIAAQCPSQAFVRVPVGKPYLLKDTESGE